MQYWFIGFIFNSKVELIILPVLQKFKFVLLARNKIKLFCIYSVPYRNYAICSCSIIHILCQCQYWYHHPFNNINIHCHNHHHRWRRSHLHYHHHHSVPSFLSFSSTNVIVYIWQTTHYNSMVTASACTHPCRLVPVIYKILKVKICTSNSTIGDLYTHNQYHYISETKQKLCRSRLHNTQLIKKSIFHFKYICIF
jgi:hypothetical protein